MKNNSINIGDYHDEEVVIHLEKDVIIIYRKDDFSKVSNNVLNHIRELKISSKEKRYLTRNFFGNSYPGKVSKKGNIEINKEFLKKIMIDEATYGTHSDEKIEIHGKKR